MRKIYSIIMATLMCCSAVFAEELKIGENDSSQKNAPVYGSDADRYQYHNQTIYLASELTALEGQQITKITYYMKSSTYKTSSDFENIQISLLEVSNDAFAYEDDFISTATAQVVYIGSIPSSTTTTFELTLSSVYVYKGGNLLVDVQKTQPSGGGYASGSNYKGFQATNTAYLTLYGKGSASGLPTSGTASTARPDIQFTYEEVPTSVCAAISSLEASNVTAHEATLTWESEASSFQFVHVAKGETPDWTDVEPQAVKTVTLENLNADTEYDFYVRSYCSAESQGIAGKISFATIPSCYAPTSLAIPEETITTTTAVVTWHASGKGETQWQYTYKVWDKNDETPNWEAEVTAVTDQLSVTLTGLNPQSMYQVWVRSYCSDEDQSAAISEYFATPCEAKELPFAEDFSADIDCWTLIDCHNETKVSDGEFNFHWNNDPQYLITPELVASEQEVKVEFLYKAHGTNFEESFQVGYSTTTKDVKSEAFTWGEEVKTDVTSYGAPYSETLPAGVKYVAIKCTSADKYYLHIDDFIVKAPEETGIEHTTAGAKSTKRIENGMLIIENNGVQYNAQGARVKISTRTRK